MGITFPEWRAERWVDVPENPLISPPAGERPNNVIADPQVILPGRHNNHWHMFAWGTPANLYHFGSSDGDYELDILMAIFYRGAKRMENLFILFMKVGENGAAICKS